MTDIELLVALSEQTVDENYPLAGLLRKCVLLGARSGSVLLREWASKELNGYGDDDVVPEYRRKSLPLFRDYFSGLTRVTGDQFHRLDIPEDVRELVPEDVHLRQSIDELEAIASADSAPLLGNESFPIVAGLWSQQLPMAQDIQRIYYKPGKAFFVGIVGAVRTRLVEIIGDLISDAVLDRLPSAVTIDHAVSVRVYNNSGDHNEVVVDNNSGSVGAGRRSEQTVNNGVLPDELVPLFAALREAIDENVPAGDERTDLSQGVADLELEVSQPDPDAERVASRARTLKRLAAGAGSIVVTTLTNETVQAALSAFGMS